MLFLFVACAVNHPPTDPTEVWYTTRSTVTSAPRVILAILDGVRVEECLGDDINLSLTGEDAAVFTPDLHHDLLPDAAVVHGARNIGVTTTYDAHVELMTGLRQPLVTFPAVNGSLWRSEAPTLFELLRQQAGLTDQQTVLVGNTPLIGDLSWSLWPGLGPSYAASWNFHTDAEGTDLRDPALVNELIDWLVHNDTRLALINLHQADIAGHFEPDFAYLDRIQDADPAVAHLWNWIQHTAPYADHTTLIVLADHGRHRGPDPDSWRGHGDQCSGCRAIPLLIAGPGIVPGDYSIPATLSDVTATAARALELPLPLGRGRPLTELYGLEAAADDAPGAISAAGDKEAWESGANLAGALTGLGEAPSLLSTSAGLLGCWRALDEGETWAAHCTLNGKDTGFPAAEGSSNWAGALTGDTTGAWLAWIHNPDGYAGASGVRPRLAFWDGLNWLSDTESPPEVSYPTRPSIARTTGAVRLAVAASDDEATGRNSRGIRVWEVSAGETWAKQSWTLLLSLQPDQEFPRLDRPALRPDGGALAWLGIAASGRASVLYQENPKNPGNISVIGQDAIPLYGLQWAMIGGEPSLLWARPGGTGIEIVRWDGESHAYPTSQPWILGMAPTSEGVVLSTPNGPERMALP